MKFFHCLTNLTFLQQVLCLIIIMNLLISQSFISIMKGITVLDENYMNPAHQLIFDRETQRQLNYYSRKYELQVKQQIDDQFNLLDTIRSLYDYVQVTHNRIHKDLIQQCSWRRNWDSYNYKTQFCYGSKQDPSQDANFKNVLALISLLNQCKMLLKLDITQDVYYVSLMPQVLGFQYPTSAFAEQYIFYDPFVDSESEFIPPFVPLGNFFMTMIAFRKLINKDGTIEGYMITNFVLNKLYNLENVNYYLVTESGIILVKRVFYASNTSPYIYNQSMTGFNYHDWAVIKNQSQTLIYNTIFKQNIEVVNIYFSEFKLYVIMCKNTTNDQIQLQLLNSELDEYYKYVSLQSQFCLLFLFIMILLIVIITTRKILKPLEQIIYLLQMNWTKQNLEQQKQLQLISLQTIQNQKYSIFYNFVRSLNQFTKTDRFGSENFTQVDYPKLNTNNEIKVTQAKLNTIVNSQLLNGQLQQLQRYDLLEI